MEMKLWRVCDMFERVTQHFLTQKLK